MLKNKKA